MSENNMRFFNMARAVPEEMKKPIREYWLLKIKLKSKIPEYKKTFCFRVTIYTTGNLEVKNFCKD